MPGSFITCMCLISLALIIVFTSYFCRLGKIYFNRLVDDIRDSPGFNMYRIINFLLKHKGYKRFFKARYNIATYT